MTYHLTYEIGLLIVILLLWFIDHKQQDNRIEKQTRAISSCRSAYADIHTKLIHSRPVCKCGALIGTDEAVWENGRYYCPVHYKEYLLRKEIRNAKHESV